MIPTKSNQIYVFYHIQLLYQIKIIDIIYI